MILRVRGSGGVPAEVRMGRVTAGSSSGLPSGSPARTSRGSRGTRSPCTRFIRRSCGRWWRTQVSGISVSTGISRAPNFPPGPRCWVPGEESVTRRAAKGFRRIVAAGIVLLAGWGAGDGGRGRGPPPASPAHALRARFRRRRVRSRVHPRGPPHAPAGRAAGRPSSEREPRGALPERELQSQIFDLFRRFDPLYGVFAAMEPDTGRVVALVGYRRGGESDPWLPLKAIYPAASLIKVVTASAAIERGNVSPQDEISDRGGIYGISRRGIHAQDGRGHPGHDPRGGDRPLRQRRVREGGGQPCRRAGARGVPVQVRIRRQDPLRPPRGDEPWTGAEGGIRARPHRRGVRRSVRLSAPHGDDHVRDRIGRRDAPPSS